MKFFIFLSVFTFSSLGYSNQPEQFTVTATEGYSGDCTSVENSDNRMIQITHMQKVFAVQKEAKQKCELATNKICGIIAWEGVVKASRNLIYGNPSTGCFAEATAVVVSN